MSYTKHDFKSGEKLYASELNEMDEQIYKNSQEIEKNKKLVGIVSTASKINVSDINGKKLILRLHKRADGGYGAENDVYLPYAKEDFSDVRIRTNSGEDIKYIMHRRINGLDILQDYRLGINARGKVFQNSEGDLISTIEGHMCITKDYGKNWLKMPSLTIPWAIPVLITSDDTLYFSESGVLYRSEKPYESFTEVLDTRESYTGTYILNDQILELEDGTLLCAGYQLQRAVRIYKSTDNGLSWTYCLNDTSGKYQHVHKMYLDTTVEPNVIYVGCDGGGGILKSEDNGDTWVDLKDTTSIPQASDKGVIYIDASGYKLFGGETAIVGGYSIIKEVNGEYRGVLGIGNGCYYITKLNGLLIAPVVSSTNHKNAAILVSNDEGENWETVFTTTPLNSTNGASDGFPFMSEIKNNNGESELILGCQSDRQPSVRVTKGCYAEIIVNVPEDTEALFIESGYNGSDYEEVVNDVIDDLPTIISYDFSSSEEITNYVRGGKHFPFIYPPIVKKDDNYAMSMKYLADNPLNVNMDFSQKSAITISFWLCNINDSFALIEELDSGNNYGIRYGGSWIYKMPQMPTGNAICKIRNDCRDVWDKADIVINFNDNTLKTYLNGRYVESNGSVDISEQLSALKNATNFKMFRKITGECNGAIQHFVIFDGAKTDKQIYDGFNAKLTDLIN